MDEPIPEWLEARIIKENHITVEIKPVAQPCDDCGRTVVNRTVRHSISRDGTRRNHIKSRCEICGLYRNPETGVYDCGFQDINTFFRIKKYKRDK